MMISENDIGTNLIPTFKYWKLVIKSVAKNNLNTYEWSPWTDPSTWADDVLFSNFSSPEYIIDLSKEN